jgi:flavoprotein hydroxylase
MIVTDVAIVGYGPVGQVLAILLAQRGHDVTVVERWPRPYPMPRATSFDGESARILSAAGIGDRLAAIAEPAREYTWRNAAGRTLLHMDVPEQTASGWPAVSSMYQPGLEAALIARGEEFPSLRVIRGHEVIGLTDQGDQAELVATGHGGERQVIVAKWVVGCDGAKSFVRGCIGTGLTDFKFHRDWLVCDVVPDEPQDYRPRNLQVCDPARPRTAVSAGPGHRRWEFMRVPGETAAEFSRIENVWRLLALFGITSGNATLQRHAVYTTEAFCANRWRSGRMLLAGDSAHVMPPFAGQGMCSGFRDAANLAWKLGLILDGRAGEGLLDTYPVERRPHVLAALDVSIVLGDVLCQTNKAIAAGRDAVMIAEQKRGQGSQQPHALADSLADGCLHRNARHEIVPPAGRLAPQGRVASGTRTGQFDQVIGAGFTLISSEDPRDLLGADRLLFLAGMGARLVYLLPPGSSPGQLDDHTAVHIDTAVHVDTAVDIDDVYLPYLAGSGALAVLIRPDFYLFGAASGRAELAALVDDIRSQISPAGTPASSEPVMLSQIHIPDLERGQDAR